MAAYSRTISLFEPLKITENIADLEGDLTTLEKISGMTIKQLIYLYRQGYTLQPPADTSFEKLKEIAENG